MDFSFATATRRNFLTLIENLNEEQLNTIPKGFRNNIFWNFAHSIVTQQILCYKLTNTLITIKTEYITLLKKGSEAINYPSEVISYFKDIAFITLETLSKDYKNKTFKEFNTYTTSFGIVLDHIEQAISFATIHEALHLGYAMAIRKNL